MKNNQKIILEDEKLLTRFLRQVHTVHDSPSLIKLVAYEGDYLVLCGAITNASREHDPGFFRRLESECHLQGLEVSIIQEKLRPVALALGLAVSSKIQTDYYGVLGISSDADINKIKKAYRKLAHKTHPDTSSKGREESSRGFVELNAAYHTLINPDLRRQYDQSRERLGLWKEHGDKGTKTRSLNIRHLYQFGGLLVFLVLVAFASNFIFQQKAIIDDPYTDIITDIEKEELKHENEETGKYSGVDTYRDGIENTGKDISNIKKTDEFSTGAMKFKLYKPELVKKYMADLSESRKRPADDEPEIHKRADKAVKESEVVKQDMIPDSKLIEPVNEIRETVPVKIPQPDREIKPEAQQVESASLAEENKPEEKLDERIRSFLRIYCETYENKNLARFTGFFTADATELDKPFHKLVPEYKENFEEIDSIRYKIELGQYYYTGNSGDIVIHGRFFLTWCRYGSSWQESRGNISMTLFENNESFMIKSLDYSFKE